MILVDKVVISLLSPLGSGLIVGLLALMLGALRNRRAALWLGALAVLWCGFWSLPGVSAWLVHRVEGDPPPLALEAVPVAPAIVVLGGGMSPSGLDASLGQPVNLGDAADRVWYAAGLYRAGRAPLVVMSGGGPRGVKTLSEAQAMALFARDLGVPERAMVLEGRSRNTRENARLTAGLLRERGIERVILVTSALHMPRARDQFEAQGLAVIAAPTDFNGPRLADKYCCLPDPDALDASSKAFKEVVGRLVHGD